MKERPPASSTNKAKRAFDVTCSVGLLVLLSPLLLFVAAVVRVTMGRPVLFRQERPGLHGQPFELVKFRTMLEESDRNGRPLPDGERLTRIGRMLRATSLDEVPELWNVLKGDMSLVGPRPLLTEYLVHYSEQQARRHEVRPGITGWAQVNGRNAIAWDQKFELDVWYVDNRTIWLDIRILLMTVARVLRRQGINQAGRATAEKFRGTDA